MLRRYRARVRRVPVICRPWGTFCYLKQNKHADPFAKRRVGAMRRAERLFKRRQRQDLLPCRDYDDGYFPLSP